MADTKTIDASGCGCCDTEGDCCLSTMVADDGLCLTLAPAVNDFDPTAGDPFRFRTYYDPYGIFSPVIIRGRAWYLELTGTTTLEGKETCYAVILLGTVICDGANFRVLLWPPDRFVGVIANDTKRVIIAECPTVCEAAGGYSQTDPIEFDCTEGTWATGQVVSVSFDWHDPRDGVTYTSTLSFTAYLGRPTAAVCPAFTGAIDPPLDDFSVDCSAVGGGEFEQLLVILNDGVIDRGDPYQWGNIGVTCGFDWETDPPDLWQNTDDLPVESTCNAAPMNVRIPATIGAGTGDCDCAGTVAFSFYWYGQRYLPNSNTYYRSIPITICGHRVDFDLLCYAGDWFIGGYVDGISTGLLAWDAEPGSDPGNANYFELHWDLFGDLCTGRLFIVGGV